MNDQCAWYGMCYLVDTTLGLVLAIWCLKLLDMLAHSNDWVSLKHSGVYEGTDGILHWIHQVLAWMGVLTAVKVIIYFFMVWMSVPLAYVGGILFSPFTNIRLELVFVMIVFPGFLNVIYFWIADSFMKAKAEHAHAHEPEEDEYGTGSDTSLSAKRASLLNADDYDGTQTMELPPWYDPKRYFGATSETSTTIARTGSGTGAPVV